MARPSDPSAKIDLLRAAEAAFVEHGLDRARVEDITSRAGRSKGSFYLHFESKEDAFRQIVESMVARLGAFVDRAGVAERPVGDVEAFLAHWLEKDAEIFEYLWQNRGLARLVFEGGQAAGYAFLIDQFAERAQGHVRDALGWGVEHGYYRADLDLEVASAVIAGAYDRLARVVVRSEKRPDLDRTMHAVQRLFVRGIGSLNTLRTLVTPESCSPDARSVDQQVKNQSPANAGRARPGKTAGKTVGAGSKSSRRK